MRHPPLVGFPPFGSSGGHFDTPESANCRDLHGAPRHSSAPWHRPCFVPKRGSTFCMVIDGFVCGDPIAAFLQTNTCTPPDQARLAVLELWVPDLQGVNVVEGFNPAAISYSAPLPESEGTAVLHVQAQDPTATIRVTYDAQLVSLISGYGFLNVPPGRSELEIRVSAPSGAGRASLTYFVHVERGGAGALLIDTEVEEIGDGGVDGGAN